MYILAQASMSRRYKQLTCLTHLVRCLEKLYDVRFLLTESDLGSVESLASQLGAVLRENIVRSFTRNPGTC